MIALYLALLTFVVSVPTVNSWPFAWGLIFVPFVFVFFLQKPRYRTGKISFMAESKFSIGIISCEMTQVLMLIFPRVYNYFKPGQFVFYPPLWAVILGVGIAIMMILLSISDVMLEKKKTSGSGG